MARGQLRIVKDGPPWFVDPKPHAFTLPDGDGVFSGLVVPSGTEVCNQAAELLGSLDTQRVAVALDGDHDVVMVGAKVRLDDGERPARDPMLHTICTTHDALMKRNGMRLLDLIGDAVSMVEKDKRKRLRAVARHFPQVAFRDRRVTALLDRMPDADDTVLRWFGQKASRGRPGSSTSERRTTVATVVHEVGESEDKRAAFKRLSKAGLGSPRGLATLRSSEGELYELSIGGVWVMADRLQAAPWVSPRSAGLRWDVYRLPV